ncbi:MAG: RNA methyltransferase [Archangium sp.]|nr:RNA methyltransferase [Archangium sp.]
MSSPPRLVLVHPRNADNLVSIAAAMKHFSLTDWVVVSSPMHLSGMQQVLLHHRSPTDFTQVVQKVRRVDTLAQAISDCSWVVGTTMRTLEGRPRLTPRELAEMAAQRRDSTWAIVFGAECNGLQNDEVDQCHAVSFIPSSEEQPSLNLSQAVVVYAHELSQVDLTRTSGEPLADDAALRKLRASVIAGLMRAGLLRSEVANRGDVDALLASLTRGGLTISEAQKWSAAFLSRSS